VCYDKYLQQLHKGIEIMALVSPGVEVTVIDESNYLPAATNTVPYILIATAQNKISGTGTGVAAGTLASNANEVYLISSQRDLSATFGNPFFYSTTAGTQINGYELNEYGLFAAYSVLGVSNRAYVQRADIDLAALTATLSRPTGNPANGAWWLDTATTQWGIFEWSFITNTFTNKVPRVITSTDDLTSGVPKDSIGSIGDYAVVTTNANNPVYYKTPGNTVSDPAVTANSWVLVGSDAWKNSWPSIIGTATNPTITAGNTIFLNDVLVTASNVTVASFALDINNAAIAGVSAKAVSGKLEIYIDSAATNDGSTNDGNGILDVTNATGTLLTDLGIAPRIYYAPLVQQSPHYTNPQWRSTDSQPHPTGSVWGKTTNVNLGANLSVNQFNSATETFVAVNAPIYENDQSANKNLDPTGGGANIAVDSVYAQYDVSENDTFTLKLFERVAAGVTAITGDDTAPVFANAEEFTIQASAANSTTLTTAVTATLGGTTAADFVEAFTAANVANTTASVTSSGAIEIRHTLGGVIVLKDTLGTPVADAGFNTTVTGVRAGNDSNLILSNWIPLGGSDSYTASATAPSTDPADGTYWYYSAVDQVDIMIHDGTAWRGYQNVSNDARGFDLSTTNPTGPIISTTAPTTQTDGTALVYGDLWIDTSDLENYPIIRRWESVETVDQWVLIDNTDQTTQNGVLFADARWATSDTVDPITDTIPTIVSLLTSNYLDIDAPNSALYPTGMLLFNLRRSGFNVKSYEVNYFNATAFPDDTLPTVKDAWVTASGLKSDGSPYMGRKAQRAIVVAALKSAIDSSQELREEQRQFTLLAAPAYPELIPNMVALNNERNNTGFIIGDTPFRLPDTATDIIAWATNADGLGVDSEDGLVTADAYAGVFYPSAQTTDLDGNTVVVPPSHMMLRTVVRSDDVSFPWLAPAGTRRGTVDNATQLGYVDAATGEFVTTAIRQGIRDTLYENNINPITFFPGTGILNYGNKTTQGTASALDRINVARLIAFVRGRLETIGKSFVFEPNDTITRNEIKESIEGLLNDLIAKRGIYDYLVVCDESNNTPARIDRNELYVDIAIEPVKAVEFIYIPVRIKNTGEIAAGQVATASSI
jgi:hypothetical protein